MTNEGVALLVAQLFAAAGRDFGETHLLVYRRALKDVPDDVGAEVVDALMRHVSWERPPSVGLVMDEVNAVLRQRQASLPALEEVTGEPVTREQALAWVQHIRRRHGPSVFVEALEAAAIKQPEEDHDRADRQVTGGGQGVRPGLGTADSIREVGSGAEAPRDGTEG